MDIHPVGSLFAETVSSLVAMEMTKANQHMQTRMIGALEVVILGMSDITILRYEQSSFTEEGGVPWPVHSIRSRIRHLPQAQSMARSSGCPDSSLSCR